MYAQKVVIREIKVKTLHHYYTINTNQMKVRQCQVLVGMLRHNNDNLLLVGVWTAVAILESNLTLLGEIKHKYSLFQKFHSLTYIKNYHKDNHWNM